MQWFLNIESWLNNKYGYSAVIHFEDTVQFFIGNFSWNADYDFS
ncbi:hypothetical protein [Clostridium neonatale]|nr:hypothetical protein [Clostridium neonatale]CAI3202458.1 hypothetical protein CNEO2_350023 [Clostridium neonatale]